MRTLLWALAPLALWLGALTTPAAAEPAAAIRPGNALIVFDTATPAKGSSHAITGLGVNESVWGIDVRPATGGVYISTVTTGSAANSQIKTYTIDTNTGVATFVGQTAAALAGAADVPTGYDFNPAFDVIRYVNTNDENARLNPTSGALLGNDTDLTPAATTTVIAAAYDRNRPGGATKRKASLRLLVTATDALGRSVRRTRTLKIR